jgi:plastocyanin
MRKSYFIPLGLILILLAGFLFWKQTKNTTRTNQIGTTEKHTKTLPKEVTVTLDKKGFSPAVVTIKAGSAVRWKNISGDKQTVNSNDYPTNQLHRELNFGVFNNDSTVVYTFTKPGTYGFHNQFHKEQTGKIIVLQ